MFSKYLQNVFKIVSKRFRNTLKIFWKYFENVFKIFWKHVQNIFKIFPVRRPCQGKVLRASINYVHFPLLGLFLLRQSLRCFSIVHKSARVEHTTIYGKNSKSRIFVHSYTYGYAYVYMHTNMYTYTGIIRQMRRLHWRV